MSTWRGEARRVPMILPTITRSSMLLRLLCGLWLVGAAVASGMMSRSPLSIVSLGAAFSVLFILGKWGAWKHALRATGLPAVLGGALTVIPTQCAIVGLFYGAGLGFRMLTGASGGLRPFDSFDLRYGALVLGVGSLLAILAHLLESRADGNDGWMRQLIEEDDSLPADLRAQILDSNRDGSPA